MTARDLLQALDGIPRLGLVAEPTPVASLDALARSLGARWLGAKRDDAIPVVPGGTKLRKLDFLLADSRYVEASEWTSVGALGSGHLVALAAAAERMAHALVAHVFWQPPSSGVLENLAFTTSRARRVAYHRDRATLALTAPRVFLSSTSQGAAVVPPGGTSALSTLGCVRAGLELAEQIEGGALPCPDRVVLPFGTGGTAVGVALGLALAGVPTRVVAVSAVERRYAFPWRLASLRRRCLALVERALGKPLSLDDGAARVTLDFGAVAGGYGVESEASLRACGVAREHALELEPIYSGKAFARLLELAAAHSGEKLLFWSTPRAAGPLPHDEGWREKLPPALARRLGGERRGSTSTPRGCAPPPRGQSPTWGPHPSLLPTVACSAPNRSRFAPRCTRRRFLVGATAGAAGLALALRVTGYPPDVDGLALVELSPWEAAVVAAAVEALVDGATRDAALESARRLDAFVATLPDDGRLEIHGLLAAVEHTTFLGGALRRLTSLPVDERERALRTIAESGGPHALLYRGMRDLAMAGFYQRPSTWPSLGYSGPMVGEGTRPSRYDALVGDAAALKGRLP